MSYREAPAHRGPMTCRMCNCADGESRGGGVRVRSECSLPPSVWLRCPRRFPCRRRTGGQEKASPKQSPDCSRPTVAGLEAGAGAVWGAGLLARHAGPPVPRPPAAARASARRQLNRMHWPAPRGAPPCTRPRPVASRPLAPHVISISRRVYAYLDDPTTEIDPLSRTGQQVLGCARMCAHAEDTRERPAQA